MLPVRAYGTRRYRTRKSIPVRVANPPLRVDVTGVVSGAAIKGVLELGAGTNERVDRVALYVDGKLVSRDASRPYRVLWDTTKATEGEHTLVVYARGIHRAALTIPVVVANSPDFPATLGRNWVTHRALENAFAASGPAS
jgi:hypothetical protein